MLPALLKRRNGRGNHSRTGLCEFGRDERNARNVLVTVLAAEAEFGGELVADGVAEEERDAAAALLVEGDVEGAGDGVFAAVLVACEEDGEALFVARWVGFAQDSDDFGVGEPFRDLGAGAEAFAEFWGGSVSMSRVL